MVRRIHVLQIPYFPLISTFYLLAYDGIFRVQGSIFPASCGFGGLSPLGSEAQVAERYLRLRGCDG